MIDKEIDKLERKVARRLEAAGNKRRKELLKNEDLVDRICMFCSGTGYLTYRPEVGCRACKGQGWV